MDNMEKTLLNHLKQLLFVAADIVRHLIPGAGHLPIAIDFLLLLAFTALFLVVATKLHQRTMPRRI